MKDRTSSEPRAAEFSDNQDCLHERLMTTIFVFCISRIFPADWRRRTRAVGVSMIFVPSIFQAVTRQDECRGMFMTDWALIGAGDACRTCYEPERDTESYRSKKES